MACLKIGDTGILSAAGPVGIFLQGELKMEGKSNLNGSPNANAEALVIFTDSAKDLKLSGQSLIGAIVYAPAAAASIDGQARLGGHLLARDIKASGDATIRGGPAMPVD